VLGECGGDVRGPSGGGHGADGLIIEVHTDPEHALTDGAQSITPAQFNQMMQAVKKIAAAVDREV
jgi:3-deoxy-7-phosphoheptulonate synthase